MSCGSVVRWGPSLETRYHSCYFLREGEVQRSVAQVVPLLIISPVPQAPLYLHCCPEPHSPSHKTAAHSQSYILVTGRKKQSSKESR